MHAIMKPIDEKLLNYFFNKKSITEIAFPNKDRK